MKGIYFIFINTKLILLVIVNLFLNNVVKPFNRNIVLLLTMFLKTKDSELKCQFYCYELKGFVDGKMSVKSFFSESPTGCQR